MAGATKNAVSSAVMRAAGVETTQDAALSDTAKKPKGPHWSEEWVWEGDDPER
jgi:hypothetical protein